ncbi:MAG: GDSL-type esterase/lipase family protein [Gemmatimonadota bacterium]
MSVPARPRRHLDLIGINLALLLIACAIATRARALRFNALRLHPHWVATKPNLARAVMGATYFLEEPQTLDRGRLHLGAWFGFQEVRYDAPLPLRRLEATVGVEADGYLIVLHDITPDGFSGVRLSARRDLPSIRFRAGPGGEFLSSAPVPLALAPGSAHHVTLEFADSALSIAVDGRLVASEPHHSSLQQIGFRSGQRDAWVDDVAFTTTDNRVVREDFTNRQRVNRNTMVLFALATIGLGVLTALVLTLHRTPARTVGLWLVLLNLTLMVLAAAAYGYQYFVPKRYPFETGSLKQDESSQISEAQHRTIRELLQRYPAGSHGGEQRLLLLGSSQTWGAGASRLEDVWGTRLEALLARQLPAAHIVCINAGVSGLTSRQVYGLLDELLPLAPQAAIITLSSNDVDTASFRAHLDSILTRLKRAGVAPVVVLEPNSPEQMASDSRLGDIHIKHSILRDVARQANVPVVDMQEFLAASQQRGLLWWDFVHLTSFGQTLVAQHLAELVPNLLPALASGNP